MREITSANDDIFLARFSDTHEHYKGEQPGHGVGYHLMHPFNGPQKQKDREDAFDEYERQQEKYYGLDDETLDKLKKNQPPLQQPQPPASEQEPSNSDDWNPVASWDEDYNAVPSWDEDWNPVPSWQQ